MGRGRTKGGGGGGQGETERPNKFFAPPVTNPVYATDCIDINTLGRRLEHTFGFRGAVLSWLRSYLNNRSQFVRVGEVKSSTSTCKFGVPQGSVLGPLLFSLYVAPIANVIASFGVSHYNYDSHL